MQQIEEYISKVNTDYAIAINGKWGRGKTYYVKNVLSNKIKKASKKMFYVSLNGISSTNELHNLIISTCTVNHLNTSGGSTTGLGERINRITEKLGFAQSVKSALKFHDFHFPESTIVVFDDLERISSNYNYKDLLGYINREFIETHNFRVILIGDFTQIKSSEFSLIKEKYIRWTVDYTLDLSQALLDLFSIFDPSNKDYYTHLLEHKEFLLSICETLEIYNLRTIKFFLEVYEMICENIDKKDYSIIIRHIIYSTLVYVVEFREGSFDYMRSLLDLPIVISQEDKRANGIVYTPLNNTKSFEEERLESNDELRKLHERFGRYTYNTIVAVYDNGTKYKYFESILELVRTGKLDEQKLIAELDAHKKQTKPILKFESNPTIDSLALFRSLKENELDQKIEELVESIRNGNLELEEFVRAINLLIYLNSEQLYSSPKKDLIEIIKEGIHKINIENSEVNFGRYSHFEMKELKNFDNSIYENINELIVQKNKFHIEQEALKILQNWEYEDDKSNAFYEIINKLPGEVIADKLITLIKDRIFIEALAREVFSTYRAVNAGEHHIEEVPKLEIISSRLKTQIDKGLDKIDRYILNQLIKQLDSSIAHLHKTV
ncbi:P-loop NTPase fold protein [Portibacter marinus]|uniref:P-loop NTPase fold protein n=1 Tax=Portibacter marinus TaxID=2898660 RepID=UPI001F171CF1|nr:P-loop NTPase fold protein [Portibacter marinus]